MVVLGHNVSIAGVTWFNQTSNYIYDREQAYIH